MAERFGDRVAVVTGGATGLGRAFAQAFHAEGAAVAILDVDSAGALSAAASLDTPECRSIAIACDVGDEGAVGRAVDEVVATLGGVDVLVNNAARHLKRYNEPFSELSSAEIRELFDVNVLGVVHCTLACRTSMAARGGGAVLNVSSLGGYVASTPYAVTKLTVRGLTIAFATELAVDGIRVNGVAPTITTTESVLAEYSDEELDRSVATRQLVSRRATPDDITGTVLFLCSDEASFVTGETIRVSGGAGLSI
jgi:NAD(P)-dependent dehydrogenase (short-subunit alcohol dehydrogenase family)